MIIIIMYWNELCKEINVISYLCNNFIPIYIVLEEFEVRPCCFFDLRI
jgi:hypothetical protein